MYNTLYSDRILLRRRLQNTVRKQLNTPTFRQNKKRPSPASWDVGPSSGTPKPSPFLDDFPPSKITSHGSPSVAKHKFQHDSFAEDIAEPDVKFGHPVQVSCNRPSLCGSHEKLNHAHVDPPTKVRKIAPKTDTLQTARSSNVASTKCNSAPSTANCEFPSLSPCLPQTLPPLLPNVPPLFFYPPPSNVLPQPPPLYSYPLPPRILPLGLPCPHPPPPRTPPLGLPCPRPPPPRTPPLGLPCPRPPPPPRVLPLGLPCPHPPPPRTPPPILPKHAKNKEEEALDSRRIEEDVKATELTVSESSTEKPLELPKSITTAVLQLCERKAINIMDQDLAMQLSQWYPCGFFEAVEALTFITQPSWWAPLTAEVTNPYFHNLWDTTTYAYVRQKVLGVFVSPPSRTYLFAPFNYTPLHKVKVLIPALGPISAKGFQSDGLAYSILPDCGVPPAHGLFQLLRELQPDFEQPPHASLQKWAVQGVLLFNISLVSLEARKRRAPTWGMISTFSNFSAGVARILDKHCEHLIILLFKSKGDNHFSKFLEFLTPGKHTIINGPDLNCSCFSKDDADCFVQVNKKLQKLGKTPIDWTTL